MRYILNWYIYTEKILFENKKIVLKKQYYHWCQFYNRNIKLRWSNFFYTKIFMFIIYINSIY